MLFKILCLTRSGSGVRNALTAPFAALALAAVTCPALAEDRDFCANRPGQTTPPCTLAPGSFMIETEMASWGAESDPVTSTDTVTFGSTLLRAGLTPRLETQVDWTPFDSIRSRDRATGEVVHQSGTGDLTLGLIYGLAGANGPVALQGFVSLPTGGSAIGAGDWGAGLRLPVTLSLGSGIQLGLTPEVDAAVNASGSGRHAAYGGAMGVGLPVSSALSLGIDVALFRDDDPDGASTQSTAGASLAWQVDKNSQLDLGGTYGLNEASSDFGLYAGISRRF